MLYIVDGTGPWLADEYNSAMSGSFCSQLEAGLGDRCRRWRGPSISGIEVPFIADSVIEEIRKQPPTEPIFLGGYSRGGAAAIVVAQKIKPRNVTAMFLFDAVDRALVVTPPRVTGNVQNVYHAIRDRSFARQFENSVKDARADLDEANAALRTGIRGNRIGAALFGGDHRATVEVRSRIDRHAVARNLDRDLKWRTRNVGGLSPSNFGNVGLAVVPPGRIELAQFAASHGALGGVPWPDTDVPGDSKAVPLVRRWMWARLIKEGLDLG